MRKSSLIIKSMMMVFCMLCYNSILSAQTTEAKSASPAVDMQKTRAIIESIDKQFSKDYLNGDSAAVAAHYAKDGQLESLKGDEILSYWGRSIGDSIKNNTRNLIFTTKALTGDGEFLIELGIYEIKDGNNNLKSKGKYVVVWKQENGKWKLYRDIGL